MRAIGALLVGLCAWWTFAQLPVWRSDRDLWRHAFAVSPELPRVSLNYGMAVIETDRQGGLLFLLLAVERAKGHPREREIRAIVTHRLRWLAAFGDPVCSRPDVSSLC